MAQLPYLQGLYVGVTQVGTIFCSARRHLRPRKRPPTWRWVQFVQLHISPGRWAVEDLRPRWLCAPGGGGGGDAPPEAA